MLQIVEPRNQNHLHVRKYYKTHRRDIIQHKIKRSYQLYGRVPRMNTVPNAPLLEAKALAIINSYHS